MDIIEIIACKRDHCRHSKEQIDYLVAQALKPDTASYQLSAWLMAAYINGLDFDETTMLTQAIAHSGIRLDLSELKRPTVDKHSTGGVGDKTTLVVLPLLAALGINIIKMSGRGLGITGGTCDKLQTVPGYKIDLSSEEILKVAQEIGIVNTGQTADLAPADKVFYALRDVTGTVSSIPLITASILSKKIAAGSKNIIMDVKCGSGAFMHDMNEARTLSESLVEVGKLCGLNVQAIITDMDQPLGFTVGNALEIKEVIHTLQGRYQQRFADLCTFLAAVGLKLCGLEKDITIGQKKARAVLDNGQALEKAKLWFKAQGANPNLFDQKDPELIKANVIKTVTYSGESGWIKSWNARAVGEAVLEIGGGRKRKEDNIDPSVGLVSHIEIGKEIRPGYPLYEIHAHSNKDADWAIEHLKNAIVVSETPVEPLPVILEVF